MKYQTPIKDILALLSCYNHRLTCQGQGWNPLCLSVRITDTHKDVILENKAARVLSHAAGKLLSAAHLHFNRTESNNSARYCEMRVKSVDASSISSC